MDANNINTGISQKPDEFTWFKPTGMTHIDSVKTSAPDFSIPPTPASSYSNLHVVLDTVHPSVQTTTRGVVSSLPSYFGRSSGPSSIPISSMDTSSSFSVTPSAPSFASRDLVMESSPSSSIIRDNRLDDVPENSFRAVLEPVNPELPGARASESLTSLKSEIAPMPVPFVALEEDFDELAERTDRQLPEAVDISLVDESQKLFDNWGPVADDIRHKNWMLHHNGPVHDSNWDRVGQQVKSKEWNLKKRPLASDFDLKSWKMIDGMEESERRWRTTRGIDGLWSGRLNRVHHELINSVVPIGWYQWFQNLKNKIANKSSDLMSSASDMKEAASDLIDAVEEEAAIDYESAKDSAKGLANKVADNLIADYEIAKDATRDLANSVADTVSADLSYAKDAASSIAGSAINAASSIADSAKDLADSASNVIANKVIDLTTTPIPKYEGPLSTDYDFYLPLSRKVPAEIIAMEEKERADRMSRGINPIVSGLWHRLGREMLHTYRDDIAAVFSGLRLKLARKGSDLIESTKDAIKSFETIKAPANLYIARGPSDRWEPVDFTFKSGRVPYEIIDMEEKERADRMSRGINPIVSGLWYRLGLELKYKYSLRPTLAAAASTFVDAASDLAGRAAETLSDLSGNVIEKSKELMTPAPVAEFGHGAPLNYFAFSAEPIDFTFKAQRTPDYIIALEEKERADRIAEGVDVLAYSKWNSLLSSPHKTIVDGASLTSVLPSLPTLSSAKESLVQSGKGISGFLGSWAHTFSDKAASMLDAAKHTQIGEAAMEYVHPDPSSLNNIHKAEEIERTRRMSLTIDPLVAARNGRVQEELLHSIKSV